MLTSRLDAADSVLNLKLSLLQKPVPASFCVQEPSFVVSRYTAGIDFQVPQRSGGSRWCESIVFLS